MVELVVPKVVMACECKFQFVAISETKAKGTYVGVNVGVLIPSVDTFLVLSGDRLW